MKSLLGYIINNHVHKNTTFLDTKNGKEGDRFVIDNVPCTLVKKTEDTIYLITDPYTCNLKGKFKFYSNYSADNNTALAELNSKGANEHADDISAWDVIQPNIMNVPGMKENMLLFLKGKTSKTNTFWTRTVTNSGYQYLVYIPKYDKYVNSTAVIRFYKEIPLK